MTEWDADSQRRWRTYLGAMAGISATADHDPLDIENAWQSAEAAAGALREHLEGAGTPVADVLADPATRPRLVALAETIDMSPAAVDWALQQLHGAGPPAPG